MEVILLEKVRNLGNLGDVVAVKAGYGRNFLVPQGKAVFATKDNRATFEKRRAELEKKAEQSFAKAQQRAAQFNDITLVIQAMASDEGKLYGSVGIHEIKEALDQKGVEVCKREIVMPEGPFHSIGSYTVELMLHSDVVANLQVEVTPQK